MKSKFLLIIVLFLSCRAHYRLGLVSSPWLLPATKKPHCLVTQFDPFQDAAIELLAACNATIYCPDQQCRQIKKQIKIQKVACITKKAVIQLSPALETKLINDFPNKPINILMCTHDQIDLINVYKPTIACVKTNQATKEIIKKLRKKNYRLFANVHNENLTFVSWTVEKPIIIQKNGLESMQLITHDRHYFALEPVPTERKVLESLERKPLDYPITYFAYPWSMLINKKISTPNFSGIKTMGGFTVCQHIRYEQMLSTAKQIGLDTIFCPHVNKKYFGMHVLPFPHYPINGADPADQKDIWFSFVGFNTHWTRKKIFNMQAPKSAIIKQRRTWHFERDVFDVKANSKEQQQKEKNEYKLLLAHSRFSLCPRGTGASTIRPWESLQAGAIPILISDDMQLPKGFDWPSCLVRISEKEVHTIVDILISIDRQQEEIMRKNCLKAYHLFIKDDFANTIRIYYENQT